MQTRLWRSNSQGFLRVTKCTWFKEENTGEESNALWTWILIKRLNCIDIGSTSEHIYLVVVKQGFICELYAGVLQSERELAVLSRGYTVAFHEIPVTTSNQTIDLYFSIKW